METATYKDTFLTQRKDFELLSSQIIGEIQEELKMVINENKRPPGGFQWRIEVGGKRATIQMYYDGMIFLFLETKYSDFMKEILHTSMDYFEIVSSRPNFIFQLTDERQLGLLIKKIKEHFL